MHNVSAQQNLSIQGKHGCNRFEIYGNYTRDYINRISEELTARDARAAPRPTNSKSSQQ